MLITSLFWCSLFTSITNNTGSCSVEVTITETSDIYAHFDGITGISAINSNVVNVEIVAPIYAPLLDGSETLYNLNSPRSVTISNGEYVGYNQYIKGWGNSTDWELECDVLITNSDKCGVIICKDDATRYDATEISIRSNYIQVKTNNVIVLTKELSLNDNTYYHCIVTKVGTTITIHLGDEVLTGTWNELTNITGFGIGGYSWNNANTKIKNIVVYEIKVSEDY